MKKAPRSISRQATRFLIKNLVRFALGLSMLFLATSQAAAQYGGGTMGGGTPGTPGYTAPSGGYSSAKGAGIGAGVAAGAGALFLVMHYRGRVTGCVQPGDDGMRLADDKNNKTYALIPSGVDLKPGERVELKGHKSKNEAGTSTFEAHKLIKELGSCGAASSASSSIGASR
jgi:hypothetical protein